MADHNTNALRAAVKALTQVVAPSVDARNPLAVEQLRLVSLYLDLHAQRLPEERRLAWKDLSLQCELARQAAAQVAGVLAPVSSRLLEAVARADAQLRHPVSPAAQWERLNGELAECLAEAIGAAHAVSPQVGEALDALVLSHARDQLLLHRVWFLPYGFEARPESLPTLDDVLAGAPAI